MLDAVMAAAFEDVEEAGQVRCQIGVRIVQRVADAGLGREIDYPLGPELAEHRLRGRRGRRGRP